MASLIVEDFRGGLDVRKSAVTAKPGTLRTLVNAFVNAGGEVEKRKAFLSYGSVAGTQGLAAVPSAPVVFGSAATGPTLPLGVNYQQLVSLPASNRRMNDAVMQLDKLYVIFTGTDGVIRHWYGTALVSGSPQITKVIPHKNRIWGGVSSTIYFTKLNDPTLWDTPSGGGFIGVDGMDGPMDLRSIGAYYNQLALLGRHNTQLWLMDQDPAKNQYLSSLGSVGVTAPQAVARVGSGDLLFLHDTGIRSMRARDASNAAIVADTGSPIDDIIRPRLLAELNSNPGLDPIMSKVEPLTGQYWLLWRDQIYVLSLVPSTGIAAWSVFTPGFNVDYATPAAARLILRSADSLYVYGGPSGSVYDNCQAELTTPMMDAGDPAADKRWVGFDAAVEGTWTVEVGTDPGNPNVFEQVATVTGATYGFQRIGLSNFGPSITIRMRSTDPSRARVGSLVLHYDGADPK